MFMIAGLAYNSQHKGRDVPSINRPLVDQERLQSNGWLFVWLLSLHWVSFSALALCVGWQEGRPACQTYVSYLQRFCFGTSGGTLYLQQSFL